MNDPGFLPRETEEDWTDYATELKRELWGEPEDDRIEMWWDKASPITGEVYPDWDFHPWVTKVRMAGVPKTSGAVTRNGQRLRGR